MVRYRWFLLGGLVGVLTLVVWWAVSSGPGTTVIDLVDRLPHAERRPSPDVFQVQQVMLGGVTKPAVFVTETSRIIWRETVPANAWLEVSLGLKEEAWVRPGDGVLFRVGISHANVYDELVSLVVNPFGNPADRQWYPLLLDLSPYAGEAVEIIFNTNSGVGNANPDNDLAVWGAPRVVVR